MNMIFLSNRERKYYGQPQGEGGCHGFDFDELGEIVQVPQVEGIWRVF